MNSSIPVDIVGNTPAFGNFFTIFWSLLNILMIVAIVILIIWYFRNKINYQKQLLSKIDSLISLLQQKKFDDK